METADSSASGLGGVIVGNGAGAGPSPTMTVSAVRPASAAGGGTATAGGTPAGTGAGPGASGVWTVRSLKTGMSSRTVEKKDGAVKPGGKIAGTVTSGSLGRTGLRTTAPAVRRRAAVPRFGPAVNLITRGPFRLIKWTVAQRCAIVAPIRRLPDGATTAVRSAEPLRTAAHCSRSPSEVPERDVSVSVTRNCMTRYGQPRAVFHCETTRPTPPGTSSRLPGST